MLDAVPSIQQTAALALGRLAEHSHDLAEAVVKEDILPVLIRSLVEENVSRFRGKKKKLYIFKLWRGDAMGLTLNIIVLHAYKTAL